MRVFSLLGLVSVVGILSWLFSQFPQDRTVSKLHGVSLESPPRPIDSTRFSSVLTINPSHVAIIPYAFTPRGTATVRYDRNHRWWGESYSGVIQLVTMARKQGLEVMIKPHVWVQDQGWAGEFTLNTEEEWKTWEQSYHAYILDFAALADSLQVPLFCIGTEYRLAAVAREKYWRQLIADVRTQYRGKITYAANWDNYQSIPFWDVVDYIGVDAYFPLDTSRHPTRESLHVAWDPIIHDLSQLSDRFDLPILFTEYGYRSVLHTAGPDWELDNQPFDEEAQQIAYVALFESIWDEPWFAGGFLWKWRYYENAGGSGDTGFTPQGKKAAATIATYYRRID